MSTFEEKLLRMFKSVSPAQFASLLFPPAYAWEILQITAGQEQPITGDYNPAGIDLELIRSVLDVAGVIGENYFRTTIEGIENVPETGAAMLVSNHNAGLMPIDGMFVMDSIAKEYGDHRIVHSLVHDYAYKTITLANCVERFGIWRANRKNSIASLDDGNLLLVYPGGDMEAFRPFKDRNKIVLAGRKGFIKVALEKKVPVIPTVSCGFHEAFIVLARGNRFAEIFGLKKLFRTDVLPFGLSLPWGLAPSFFNFLPLPAKTDICFGKPLILEGDPDDPVSVDKGYDLVEQQMQSIMDELSEGRLPWLGKIDQL